MHTRTHRAPRFLRRLAALLTLAIVIASPAVSTTESAQARQAAQDTQSAQTLGGLPLVFEPNHGQTDEHVRFLGRAATGLVFLTDDAIVLSLDDPDAAAARQDAGQAESAERAGRSPSPLAKRHVVSVRPVGAAPATVEGTEPLDSRSTYMRIGLDTTEAANGGRVVADVGHFAGVTYRGLYDGVDLKVYGDGPTLRYDWIVAPGGDPSDIVLRLDGAASLHISEGGELIAETPFGPLAQAAPFTYQEIDGVRVEIASRFDLGDDGLVRFEVADYDRDRTLVIDPSVAWKRCLNGSIGSSSASDSAVTANGQAYMVGYTADADFPTPGGLQKVKGEGYDVFVAKLRIDGTLHRATFLDSGQGYDIGRTIELDDARNVYVSGDYSVWDPVAETTTYRSFVTKLGPYLDTLGYSRSFGEQDFTFQSDLAVDGAGNVLVVGDTNSTTFCSSGILAGKCVLGNTTTGWDGFLVRFDRWGNVSWARLLGDGVDAATMRDDDGSIHVAGTTYDGDLRFTWIKRLYSTGTGGFWTYEIKPTWVEPNLPYYTFVTVSDLDIDDLGNTYVIGRTTSAFLPVKNAVQPSFGGGFYDAFVGQVNSSGSGLVFLTYLGSANHEEGRGIAVGSNRHAYVVGVEREGGNGDIDMFVARYSAGGSGLVFYRTLGGSQFDHANGVSLDSSRNMYIAGSTASADFAGPGCGPLGSGYETAALLIKYLP